MNRAARRLPRRRLPASPFAGLWTTWQHPETGQTLTGIIIKWLLGERTDPSRRKVIPSDGSEPVVVGLEPLAKPTAGPGSIVYGPESSSPVQPGVQPLELV
ncbi:hypothetical protein ACFWOY_23225 [Streptomyces sp. NPDC058423]|uniref:hypothetical protein n=1 Tax=unclassified Streptomyces TaxID=2593676 RepID=UPI0036531513